MGKRSWKSKSSSRSSSGSTCIARRQAARYVPLKVPIHGQHVPAAQHSALVRHNTVLMGLSSVSSPWSSALTCDGKEGAGIHMIPVFFLYRFLIINSQLLGHSACLFSLWGCLHSMPFAAVLHVFCFNKCVFQNSLL